MGNQVRLYALKCGEEYIKFSDSGYTLTTMQKASVFMSPDELQAAAAAGHLEGGCHMVELTITERELEGLDGTA